MRAKHILIATGGAPSLGKDIEGREHVISSNEAFHLKELPKRILIQGGGYIAVEFAGIFNGLGSEVTLVYRGDNILRGFDDDVRNHLRAEMEKRGIKIVTKKIVEAIEKVDHGLCVELSDHENIMVDKVMFATGRRPNVKGLGLEAAGVKLDRERRDRGQRILADHRAAHLRGRRRHRPHRAHAGRDPRGPCLRRHACSASKPTPVDHTNVPTAVFSEPEVGVIGLTEAQACEHARQGRHLQDHVPADEGDAVRPRHPHLHEARGRRQHRPRGRLPHRRAGRRRDDPARSASR